MKYLPLFSVRARHDRYPDGVCPDLEFVPTAATQQVLARYRLRLHESPAGVAVWTPARADGKAALVPLARDEVFAFALRLRNPEFALFTDLADFAGKTDPVFSNAALGAADARVLRLIDRKSWRSETFVLPAGATPVRLTLAAQPLALNGDVQKQPRASDFAVAATAGTARVTAYDAPARAVAVQASMADQTVTLRYRVRAPVARDALAEVQLLGNRSMPAVGRDEPPFEIRFKARAARWVYYLVTDQPGEFSIVDDDAVAPIVFGAQNTTVLDAGADGSDPLAATLAFQYPAYRRIRFVSDQPVPCSSVTRRGIALRHGGQRALEALPNASYARPSRIRLQAGGVTQDQDSFCQVIKYLKSR